MRKRLLFVGDSPTAPSGFARGTRAYVKALDYREGSGDFEVTVLGLNYLGDPHAYPYPIYGAAPGGDPYGIGRIIWTCDVAKPDVIVIQNDPWNMPLYLDQLAAVPEYKNVPIVGVIAVDGKNCAGSLLNRLSLAVFWTEFGMREARRGGYTGPAVVIPLGVDRETFRPCNRAEARKRLGLPDRLRDSFIVGNVNRNQPRKRWDLTLQFFADWVHQGPLRDAYLYLHVAPTGDKGIKVEQLAHYLGIRARIILRQPAVHYGIDDAEMCDTYNAFDVQISTTQGEGFGLTTFEGMACGVPQIVPDWSALGELCRGAANLVPCTSTAVGEPYVNVIGGVADGPMFVRALDDVYRRRTVREELRRAGLMRAAEERFKWETVGEAFRLVVSSMLRHHEQQLAEQAARREEEVQEAMRVAFGLGGPPAIAEEEWRGLGHEEEVA